jgi:hypothetical protein
MRATKTTAQRANSRSANLVQADQHLCITIQTRKMGSETNHIGEMDSVPGDTIWANPVCQKQIYLTFKKTFD